MALVAYNSGASGPVQAVVRALEGNGCNWTFHRVNARVVAFLKRDKRKKLEALEFHFELFKIAENKEKNRELLSRIRGRNPRKYMQFLLEARERPDGTLTVLSEAEESALGKLIARSRTLKSHG